MSDLRFVFTAADLDAFARDGFLITRRVLDDARIERLRARFDALYQGEFETGVRPDEVNWRAGESDPALTRQICNAWKADRTIARVVLDAGIGEAIARLANWSGVRVIQDNVLWKPPGAGALGMHQDTAYLAWLTVARWWCTAGRPMRDSTRPDSPKATAQSTRVTAASPTTRWTKTTSPSPGAQTATAAPAWMRLWLPPINV